MPNKRFNPTLCRGRVWGVINIARAAQRGLTWALGSNGTLGMGADSFIVCFGLRWDVDSGDEEQITRLEHRLDPRQLAARPNNLQCWWGSAIDEDSFVVLLGSLIGPFGWEGESSRRHSEIDAQQLSTATRQALLAAGFLGSPEWHYCFVPDR